MKIDLDNFNPTLENVEQLITWAREAKSIIELQREVSDFCCCVLCERARVLLGLHPHKD